MRLNLRSNKENKEKEETAYLKTYFMPEKENEISNISAFG